MRYLTLISYFQLDKNNHLEYQSFMIILCILELDLILIVRLSEIEIISILLVINSPHPWGHDSRLNRILNTKF